MKSNFLNPISEEIFIDKVTSPIADCSRNYMEYFKPYLDKIDTYSIGPYYWFIPDNSTMRVIATSENMSQLTPYSNFDIKNWELNSVRSFADMIHLEDREYVLSAIQYVIEKIGHLTPDKRNQIKFNIYGRFKNSEHVYRWIMMQFPAFYVVKHVESQIVLITDLSHLNLIGPPLLTICDYSNKIQQYFKMKMDPRKEIPMNMPKITNREKDIIRLMAKGLKSPEIAKILFISYSTVENHRKNLRIKTKTKTSVELLNFIIFNNLLSL